MKKRRLTATAWRENLEKMFRILILCIFLSGCASMGKEKGRVIERVNGVDFKCGEGPCKISWERDNDGSVKASYDNQSPSILRTIVESAAIKEANK